MRRCFHCTWSAILLAAACTRGEAKVTLNEPVIDSLPGGVVRVTNPGPTAWADTSGWQLVEDLVVAPSEGEPGELSDISAVVGDSRGNVYVFQQRPALIRVYGPDGNWLRNIGRDGDGPGEYRSGMFGIHRDTLFVQDPNNTRFTTFLTSGEFIASHPSQCCWWTSNFPTFDDGTVGIPGPPPANAKDHSGAMYLTRMNGDVIDTILFPERRPSLDEGWTVKLTSGNSQSIMAMDIPLKPTNQSAYIGNRRRVVGNTAAYQLAITDLNDDTLRIFTAPPTAFTITEAQRDSIFNEEVEGVGAQWKDAVLKVAKVTDIPTTWPAWSGIMIDGSSRIWIGRPGPRGENSYLDVFSPDGVLLGTVRAPDNFSLHGKWVGDKLYQRSESDEGLPQVKVYRIETKVRTDAEDSR